MPPKRPIDLSLDQPEFLDENSPVKRNRVTSPTPATSAKPTVQPWFVQNRKALLEYSALLEEEKARKGAQIKQQRIFNQKKIQRETINLSEELTPLQMNRKGESSQNIIPISSLLNPSPEKALEEALKELDHEHPNLPKVEEHLKIFFEAALPQIRNEKLIQLNPKKKKTLPVVLPPASKKLIDATTIQLRSCERNWVVIHGSLWKALNYCDSQSKLEYVHCVIFLQAVANMQNNMVPSRVNAKP